MVRGSATIGDEGLNTAFKAGFDEGRSVQAEQVYKLTVYRGGKAISDLTGPLSLVREAVDSSFDLVLFDSTVTFEISPVRSDQAEIDQGPSVPNDDEVVDAEIVG